MIQDNQQPGFNQGPGKESVAPKASYMLNLDRVKIFWIFVLTILVLTFVFVFGYWTGQHNINEFAALAKEMQPIREAVDKKSGEEFSSLLAEEREPKAESMEKTLDKDKSEEQSLKNDILDLEEKSVRVEAKKERMATETPRESKRRDNTQAKSSDDKGKKYIIQLATFTNEKRAVKMRESLLGKGFGGYVVRSGNQYIVRVGKFSEYQLAANTLGEVMRKFRIRDAYIYTQKS